MSSVIPLLKFTPSAQDPQVLEAITVQREPLIEKLVEIALDDNGGLRHQLLIGPRGIGKTHILSLVASRVREEERSDSITLAWLEEDPWSIGSYEKFIAAIVGRVAAERSDPALAERADALHATRDPSGGEGEQVLRDALGGSRLVLLAENLDEIFGRIGGNGQERFRAFVENWQQLLVLATAPQLFEGIQLHESPFYGFFAITHLEELSLASATDLMRRVAELRGDSDLVEFLHTDVASRRLAAIEALAGGHPRIWLLLSGCVSIKAIDELVPLFLEALDDLTPYYQDRLRELGHQQQELVVLLSDAGGALSNRALAERSGIAQNQIATILRQLSDRGYVRRAEISDEIATGDARMSFWELREPLMRLCLDVKQSRGRPLRMIVEFLRAWYGPRLLDELVALPSSAELATTYVSEAFRTFEGDLPVEALFDGSPGEILARAERGLSVAPGRPELRIARVAGFLLAEQFGDARDALEEMIAEESPEQAKLVLRLQLVTAKEALGEPVDLDSLAEGLLELSNAKPADADAQEFVAAGLTKLERYEEALRVFPKALELRPEDASLLGSFGKSLGETGRWEESLLAFTDAVALEPTNAWMHASRGVALEVVGRGEEALEALATAVEIDPDNAEYWRLKGAALVSLERHEQALEDFARSLELEPDSAQTHLRQSVSLVVLGRSEEALSALTKATETNPFNGLVFEMLGILLTVFDRVEEALAAFAKGAEVEPSNARIFNHRGSLLLRLGRLDEAEREIRQALLIWSETRETWAGGPGLLCQLLWEDVDPGIWRREAIGRIVEAYDEVGAGEELGRALVSSISWMADPEVSAEMSDEWAVDWLAAREVDDLQIPFRLLRAANEWKKDRDQAHLLDLPPEQRKILVDLLAPKDESGAPPGRGAPSDAG
jgi:Flp pilus assembly protein TadD